MDMQGSHHILVWVTIPEFVWKGWGKR